MFESKSGVLLVAGLGFFIFAFLSNALVPALMYRNLPEVPLAQIAEKNSNLMYQFEDLSNRYPEQFKSTSANASAETLAEALHLGRQVYVSEGCWHCHSQFVRPVSREEDRWGPVSRSEEYQNVLQRPVMFGTRRVGPDLEPRGGTPRQRLARRALLSTHAGVHRVADARVSLVLRRLARSAQPSRAGRHHLRAMVRLVVGKLPVLRDPSSRWNGREDESSESEEES